MLRRPTLALLSLAVACGPTEPIDTDLPTTTPPEPTTTTGPLYQDAGNIVLTARHAEVDDPIDRVVLVAVFAASIRDYANLATCLAMREETYCASELPQVFDEGIDVEFWDEALPGLLEIRDVGPSVTLGPYVASGAERQGLWAYFNSNLAAFGPPQDGELGLSFEGGDFGDYSAEDVVPVPDQMEVLQPDPLRRITLSNGVFPLRWTPGLVGHVYLSVETETVKKLFLLEDDGTHDLDVDALGLTADEEVKLTLARWAQAVHVQEGNEIEILVQDEQILRGTYRDLTGRTLLEGSDSCAAALYQPPLASGAYFGRLSENTNQLSPIGACGNAGGGPETILRTDLNPGGEISVTYAIFNYDAALYLMTGCGDFGTCVLQSNVLGNSAIEQVSWVSDLPGPSDVFIVLDSRSGPVTDLFLLDVDRVNVYGNTLVDSCAEALYQAPLTSSPAGTDRYLGNISTYRNYADPAGGCGVAAPGQEGMVKIELASGETLTATVEMPGANPSLYLLYNCSNGASCPVGSDANTDATETVTYTNTTAANEVLYLIVDSLGGSASYVLDVLIE